MMTVEVTVFETLGIRLLFEKTNEMLMLVQEREIISDGRNRNNCIVKVHANMKERCALVF